MGKHTSIGQLAELIAADNAGDGMAADIQHLIVMHTIRRVQAKAIWDPRLGEALGYTNFESYLGTIPKITDDLMRENPEFPLLSLVETRVDLPTLCRRAGISYDVSEDLMSIDERHAEFDRPTWIRVHDGRVPYPRKPRIPEENPIFLTARQGVCAYIHHREAIRKNIHTMFINGSVTCGSKTDVFLVLGLLGETHLYSQWTLDERANDAATRSASSC